MVVMQLLRALGLGAKVRVIADALTRNAALLEEALPDEPSAEQLTRLRALLKVLEGAAIRPAVLLDGRPVPASELHEFMDNVERRRAAQGAAGA